MRCQLNLRTFVSAKDVESELEAVDAYCLVLFDTTDAKTIELIEDETDVILIENKNATEEENKEQNAQKEEKEEVDGGPWDCKDYQYWSGTTKETQTIYHLRVY